MSDTPRTDRLLASTPISSHAPMGTMDVRIEALIGLARKLERELAEAQSKLDDYILQVGRLQGHRAADSVYAERNRRDAERYRYLRINMVPDRTEDGDVVWEVYLSDDLAPDEVGKLPRNLDDAIDLTIELTKDGCTDEMRKVAGDIRAHAAAHPLTGRSPK